MCQNLKPSLAKVEALKMATSRITRFKYSFIAFAMVTLLHKCQSLTLDGGDILPLGKSLTGNQTILSKKGTFELGFFSPNGKNHYYIGIWYAQIFEKMVVWVANRETPLINMQGVLKFTSDGHLRLFDSRGRSIWSSDNTMKASRAMLLESGNFIMSGAHNSSETVWESFRYPGDTLLPGMKMWKGMKLTSWKSSADPAPGPFSYAMDPSPGKTQFMMLYDSSVPYLSTGEWVGDHFTNMPGYGAVGIKLEFVTISPLIMYCTFITSTVMDRVTMNNNGELGRYHLAENGGWSLNGITPRDQCNVYNVCGAYAACNAYATSNVLAARNASDVCKCLEGFRPKDNLAWDNQEWWSSGCVRQIPLQCAARNGTTDGFMQLKDKYLNDNQAISYISIQTLEGCQSVCLNNCSCTSFAVTNSTPPVCLLWVGDLLNVRDEYDSKSVFLRLAASELRESTSKPRKKSVPLSTLLPVGAAGLAAVSGLLLAVFIMRKRRRVRKKAAEEDDVPTSLRTFTFKELRIATKNFSHKLGSGAFGSVFKGTLPDNTLVAVKKLQGSAQAEKQFRAEISTIGNIQHVNLVRLWGFCAEGSKRLLVYEYMPNGSLNSMLFHKKEEEKVLNWKTRFLISLGTARGLVYLHEECRDRIIHCDIKPENILLDGDFRPKVADFGLAKLVGRDFSRVLTTTRGTRGYLAPEWISGLPITPKADVYSFGMTLLELISGRRNLDLTVQKSSTYYYPPWAATQIHKGNLMGIVDERISKEADAEEVRRTVTASVLCIQEDENVRPNMAQVVQILEGTAEADEPQFQGSLHILRDHEEDDEDSESFV